MTFKSRWTPGLLALLVVLTLAPASFAQVSLQISTDPSTNEIGTNHMAQTASPGVPGDGILISGVLVANSNLSTTTLIFTYPAPITSGSGNPLPGPRNPLGIPAIPTADPIRIEGASGVFASVSNPSVSTTAGTVAILLPVCGSSPPLSTPGCNNTVPAIQPTTINTQGGLFRLVGVRIDANGKTGAQNVTPALDSVTNNYLLSSSAALPVISNIVAAGVTVSTGARTGTTTLPANQGPASIFTNRASAKPNGTLLLTEGCANCWRSATQSSNSTSAIDNGTNIKLTFTGVPTGVTLTLSSQASTFIANTLSNATITPLLNTTTVSFTGTSLASTEQVEIDYNVTAGTSTTALTPGAITVTATIAPNDSSAFSAPDTNGNVTVTNTGGYPRFTDTETAPVTVVNIVPSSTTMLIPYALVAGAIDTGIEIANTTLDAFPTGGAIPTNGTLKFDFFPSTATGAGTPFSVQTSATSRVNNLDSNGNLIAGSILAVNTSQLLPLAGIPSGGFQGYIFITANFLNAHGVAFMSDYKTFFLSEAILVLPPPAAAPRSAPQHGNIGNGVEELSF